MTQGLLSHRCIINPVFLRDYYFENSSYHNNATSSISSFGTNIGESEKVLSIFLCYRGLHEDRLYCQAAFFCIIHLCTEICISTLVLISSSNII